jgi:hypothetical protein
MHILPRIASQKPRTSSRSLRVGIPALISAFALIGLFSQAAFADPRDFTLENDSLAYVTHLYVSASSSDSWGDDVLGEDVLPPGESVDITFDTSRDRTCIYDLLVVTENGARTRKNRENLCTTTTEYYSED